MSFVPNAAGVLAVSLTFLGGASSASAADWYVDVQFAGCATGDGSAGNPFCDIADAIAAAGAGDTIHVAPGTYAERLTVAKDLTIVGTGGRDVTIVDATKSGRALLVKTGRTVTVIGITFTEGLAFPGAGVRVESTAKLTLDRCSVFRNGDAADESNGGGGIAVDGSGNATLVDTLVEENATVYEGGGIRMLGSSKVTLTRCGVFANFCGFDDFGAIGGGIYNSGGTLTIDDSSICRNAANRFGSAARGAGIYTSGGSLTITDSAICDNNVFSYYSSPTGGGIHLDTAGALLEDVLVSGNSGGSSYGEGLGAGLWIDADVTLSRVTIAGNSGGTGGGVLVNGVSIATFDHSILAGNTATTSGPDCEGTLTSAGYNLVGDTSGCTIVGSTTGNQLDVDPLFADPANGDFRLTGGSPALEAGDPALQPDGTDASGLPRVLDGDFDRVMRIDLGGLELGHVELAVSGDSSPGGSVTLDATGTAGLSLFLLIGTAPGDLLFRPFGRLFLDVASPWLIVPFGTVPSSVTVAIPSSLPSGTIVILQDLAFDPPTRAGNLSNAVTLRIE